MSLPIEFYKLFILLDILAEVHGNRMHYPISNHLISLTIHPVILNMCLVCACLFFNTNGHINFFELIVLG